MDIKYDLRLPMQIQWWKKTFKERINQERGKGRNSHFSVVFKLSTLFGSLSFPNACFNKVFKLTVTNNFQFCLWGKNLSAKCIKNFISKKGENAIAYFCFIVAKSRRYTITSQKRHKNAKTAKDER